MLMSKNTQCCTFRTSNTITKKWITITQSQRTTLITDPDLAVTFAFWNFLLFLSSSAARSKSTFMNLVTWFSLLGDLSKSKPLGNRSPSIKRGSNVSVACRG